MGRRQFFINIFAIAVLFLAAFLFTSFSEPIRKNIHLSQKAVAGASTDNKVNLKAELPEALVKDAGNHASDLKERVLKIELGVAVEFVGKSGKIVQDIQQIPIVLEQTIQSLIKKEK